MDKSAGQWMIEPLRKYATFSGRARRKEFWWFRLLLVSVAVPLVVLTEAIAPPGNQDGAVPVGASLLLLLVLLLADLALIVPAIAVDVRRLHDLDKSGWWYLLLLVPIVGPVVLLVWYCQRGTVGDNRFGPDPLAENESA